MLLALFSEQGFSSPQLAEQELGIVGGGMLQEIYQPVLHLDWIKAEIREKLSLIQQVSRQKSIMNAGITSSCARET